MQNSNDQWTLLAGIRFFLALSVVTCHCNIVIGPIDTKNLLWTFGGFTAVIGFFIISGYSIAHSIEQKPEGYARRRFVRIYPLYFFSLLFGLLPFALFGHMLPLASGEISQAPTPAIFITTLFMLNGVIYLTPVFVHHFWSLNCEALYYCIAPVLRKLSAKKLLFLILLSAELYVAHAYFVSGNYPSEAYGIAAVCLFWAWLMGFAFFRFRKNYKLLFAFALLGTAMLCRYGADEGHMTFVTYFLVVLSLLFIDKIALSSKWVKILNYLGDLSYPLYLTHWTVLILLSRLPLIKLGYGAVPICWICAIAVSMIFYHLIDVPIRRRYSTSNIKNRRTDLEPQHHASPA